MTKNILENQYLLLYKCFYGNDGGVNLQDISDALSCSKRHASNIVARLVDEGLIDWKGVAGRGHKSALKFLARTDLVEARIACSAIRRLSAQENKALKNINETTLASYLRQSLDLRPAQDSQVKPDNKLIVHYYRSIVLDSPFVHLRRTERHLIGYLYKGLVSLNHNNGLLNGEISHYWENIEPLIWRFHLRKKIYLHSGKLLTAENIAASLTKDFSIFSKNSDLEMKVYSANDEYVDVAVNYKFAWVPYLLGSPLFSIAISDSDSSTDPADGVGPYKISNVSNDVIELASDSLFYGVKPLVDSISICQDAHVDIQRKISTNPGFIPGPYVSSQSKKQEEAVEHKSKLELGCYFAMISDKSKVLNTETLRAIVLNMISPIAMLQNAKPDAYSHWVPATGLIPNWNHRAIKNNVSVNSINCSLKVIYHTMQPELESIAALLSLHLARYNVDCELIPLPFESFCNPKCDVDIVLSSVNFFEPRTYSIPSWFFLTDIVRHHASSFINSIQQMKSDWCNGHDVSETISKLAIEKNVLVPLYHHWLNVYHDENIRNVEVGLLGWFQLDHVWIKNNEH